MDRDKAVSSRDMPVAPRLTVDCMVPFCGWSRIYRDFGMAKEQFEAHRHINHRCATAQDRSDG